MRGVRRYVEQDGMVYLTEPEGPLGAPVCVMGEPLAVAFTVGEEPGEGHLAKHGSAEAVERWVADRKASHADDVTQSLETRRLRTTHEMLEVMNAHIVGRGTVETLVAAIDAADRTIDVVAVRRPAP